MMFKKPLFSLLIILFCVTNVSVYAQKSKKQPKKITLFFDNIKELHGESTIRIGVEMIKHNGKKIKTPGYLNGRRLKWKDLTVTVIGGNYSNKVVSVTGYDDNEHQHEVTVIVQHKEYPKLKAKKSIHLNYKGKVEVEYTSYTAEKGSKGTNGGRIFGKDGNDASDGDNGEDGQDAPTINIIVKPYRDSIYKDKLVEVSLTSSDGKSRKYLLDKSEGEMRIIARGGDGGKGGRGGRGGNGKDANEEKNRRAGDAGNGGNGGTGGNGGNGGQVTIVFEGGTEVYKDKFTFDLAGGQRGEGGRSGNGGSGGDASSSHPRGIDGVDGQSGREGIDGREGNVDIIIKSSK